MAKRGLLIVFSGPSGVGKGTVLQYFFKRNADCIYSISATTRTPRIGEEEGKDYYFITREKFGELAAKGEMLEYAEYNGNYYGTPKAMVEKQRNLGKHVILEIEVKGALEVRKNNPDAVLIFVMPPSWEALRRRLSGRGTDLPDAVEERMRIAGDEIALAREYDYVIVNDSVEGCAGQLRAVISAAACVPANQEDLIREVLEDAQAIDVPDHRQA